MMMILSNVIFKTLMVPLHRAKVLVVHLNANFSMDTLDFPSGANYYPKLPVLVILGAISHIFKATRAKFGVMVRTWDSIPHTQFCKKKKLLTGIYPFEANCTKKYQFWQFRVL